MSAALYTPAVLAAATGLAAFPWDEALPLTGEARSRACGSTLALALAVDAEGRITRVGLRPHACAIGRPRPMPLPPRQRGTIAPPSPPRAPRSGNGWRAPGRCLNGPGSM